MTVGVLLLIDGVEKMGEPVSVMNVEWSFAKACACL